MDARHKIFEFSQQLDGFGRNLSALVGDLFAENVYQDAPILRGLYFTSGTQEGRPIDRIMQNMASAFGISGRAASSVAVSKPKSYFVRDLFTQVVFPDKDVAIRSTRVMLRQRIVRWALTACVTVAAAGLLFLPVRSYNASRDFVQEARRFVDRLGAGRQGQEAPGVPSAAVLESVEATTKILGEENDSALLFPRTVVVQQLHTTIERLLVRPILRTDVAKNMRPGGLPKSEMMDALVLHLLLTQEKQPEEPTPRTGRWDDAIKLAGQKAAVRWERQTGGPVAAARAPRVVDSLVRTYAAAIEDPADLIDRDRKFVSEVRAALLGEGDDPVAEIVNDSDMPRDLKLVDILGGASVFVQGAEEKRPGTVVRGAFTPAGYRIVKQRLAQLEKAQDVDEDTWILGKERKVRDARTMARIKAEYFNQYLGAWKAFLLTLAVREPSSIDQGRIFFKRLAAEKPFDAIWRNLNEYLILKDDSLASKALDLVKDKVDKAAEKRKLSGVDDELPDMRDPGARLIASEFDALLRFGTVKPSGFDQYNQILIEVTGAMGEPGTTPDPKALQAALKTARTNLSALLARYNDRGWEQGLLERILMPPLRGSETAAVGATSDLANRKWCETVVVAFNELLAGKFPFSHKATSEARLADVEKFFQPGGGILWQYFATLQNDIEQSGPVFRQKEGASVRYRDDFFRFWAHAQELTSRLFAKDPAKVGLPIEVRIRPSAQFSKIVFDTGAKRVVGLNALERWDGIVWPSRRALVHLYVKSNEVEAIGPREDGDWVLFRLLAQGTSLGKTGGVLSLSFPSAISKEKIQIDFRPDNIGDLFQHFSLPRVITPGAAACRH